MTAKPAPIVDPSTPAESMNRRNFMAYFSAMGLGGTLFPGVLWARMQQAREVTKEMIADAEALAVAKAYQDATDFHRRRPPLFAPGAERS